MIGFFRRLRKDKRGNVLAIAAAAIPLVIGCAGLAVDTIQWTLWKRQLQRAADSAAIAGAYDRENASGSSSNTSTAVANDLAVNYHLWVSQMSGYPQISYPANSGSKTDEVQVTLAIQKSLPFSNFFSSFGFAAPIITASATAASISTGTPCMMSLSTTGTGIDNTGNTTINAPTCILYSDSAAANAAAATGSSSVTVKAIAAVGSIAQSNNWVNATYMPNSPSLADPFSSITPASSDMKCAGHYVSTTTTTGNGKNKVTTTTQTWVYDSLSESTDMTNATYLGSDGQTHTGANCWTSLSTSSSNKTGMTVPSTYSGPIYIDANATHGGTGSVTMQGDFTCSSCTIVMTNSDSTSSTIGTWTANAQSQTNITAPTSGTYKGIAIYQDRRATAANSDKINGGSSNVISGVVYLPEASLTINGTGTASSLCAMWVADYITFSGNSGIALSSPDDSVCSGVGVPSTAAVKMVRLVA